MFNSRHGFIVARILHNLDRKYRPRGDRDFIELIHELIEMVRVAYVSNSIPLAARLPLHFLSYYKDSGHLDQGVEFWNWLSKEDDAHLDPVFVGAAIELLAVYGAGIHHCELVYQRMLDSQEDISSQYQLQPGAILPDRSKAVKIKGTSLGLLQGILSARLFYGKWRSSYLTLDTAFRLRPTQLVPRVLDLFVYERPIFEALPVFFMFCRGGNRVSKTTLAAILVRLKKLADQVSKCTFKIDVVRTMFQTIEAYIGSAGILNTRHLNILIRAVVYTMPPLPAPMATESSEDGKDVTKSVIDLFKQLLGYFAQHNAVPDAVTFNGTIVVALSLGYPLLARALFEDMVNLSLSPNEQTAQSLLEAACMLEDPVLLKTAWLRIRGLSETTSSQMPDPRSWRTMAIAARRCGLNSFYEDQSKLLDTERAEAALEAITNEPIELTTLAETTPSRFNTDEAHRFIDLCAQASNTINRMQKTQPGDFRNFDEHPLDQESFLAWPDVAQESWQRKLYDELTLSQSREGSYPTLEYERDGHETVAVSNTGVEFDKLRYLSWITINNLLIQAEEFEKHLEASTNAAIRDRKAQQKGSRTTEGAAGPRYPVTIDQYRAYRQDIDDIRAKEMTEEEWRHRILRLRNTEYESQTFTNTVSPT
ncbi:MAG: hypothetical protein Q9166_006137 [cf. Caloplaca sp. 2 TL-2023]